MKSSGLAAVLSLFFPGVGQIYNGRFLSGVLWLLAAGFNWLLTVILIGYLTGPILHLLSAYSAYRQAEKINKSRGGVSSF